MGGRHGSAFLNSLEVYNPNTNTWVDEPPHAINKLIGAVIVDKPSNIAINGLCF